METDPTDLLVRCGIRTVLAYSVKLVMYDGTGWAGVGLDWIVFGVAKLGDIFQW